MDLGNGLGHLTYSTLVHPGDTWAEMWNSLTTYVPKVKARVCPDAPFGVSLRISNASAKTLTGRARNQTEAMARPAYRRNDLQLAAIAVSRQQGSFDRLRKEWLRRRLQVRIFSSVANLFS